MRWVVEEDQADFEEALEADREKAQNLQEARSKLDGRMISDKELKIR